jgi:hypothetical protein
MLIDHSLPSNNWISSMADLCGESLFASACSNAVSCDDDEWAVVVHLVVLTSLRHQS